MATEQSKPKGQGKLVAKPKLKKSMLVANHAGLDARAKAAKNSMKGGY